MINALGLLEVYGLVAGIEAADAMLKSANVRLLSYSVTNPGLVTLVVEGDLAACRASLDAGSAAASKLGKVICRKEIGRPDKGTEWFVQSFTDEEQIKAKAPSKVANESVQVAEALVIPQESVIVEKKEEVVVQEEIIVEKEEKAAKEKQQEVKTSKNITEKKTPVTQAQVNHQDDSLLAFLYMKAAKGANLTEIAKQLSTTADDVKQRLQKHVTQKIVRKKNNRYYMIEGK